MSSTLHKLPVKWQISLIRLRRSELAQAPMGFASILMVNFVRDTPVTPTLGKLPCTKGSETQTGFALKATDSSVPPAHKWHVLCADENQLLLY